MYVSSLLMVTTDHKRTCGLDYLVPSWLMHTPTPKSPPTQPEAPALVSARRPSVSYRQVTSCPKKLSSTDPELPAMVRRKPHGQASPQESRLRSYRVPPTARLAVAASMLS
ncbi:unnamed protein product [Phytophthora lilii]|uniref:Unnamed protein product n=1 Tax=Phytophthora lilii TaxID=2077276 RepID=A0A9W6TCV8_9STRA|nr:unnamed protein product [Phytophthora lilii]